MSITQADTRVKPPTITLASMSSHQSRLLGAAPAGQQESKSLAVVTIRQGLVSIAELNRSIHARSRRYESHADWMAQSMKEGHRFHAIEIFWDPVLNVFWVADGEHRIMAHEINHEQYILANVHVGGRREALTFALGCDLGLRRKGADWRQCIRLILHDPESAKLTARAIARRYGIDHKTVTKYRRELGGVEPGGDNGNDDESQMGEPLTGEIPQLISRTPETETSLGNERVPSSAALIQDTPDATPPDRVTKAQKLAKSIIGSAHPVALQEVLESISQVLESDASLDVHAMFALALAWGVDDLRCPLGSSPLRVTPKQWLAQVRANKAADEAASKALRAAVSCESPVVDRIQYVIGARSMNFDELVAALKDAKMLPGGSDPQSHVRFELSRNRSTILRTEDNQYYLDDQNPYRIAQACAGNS